MLEALGVFWASSAADKAGRRRIQFAPGLQLVCDGDHIHRFRRFGELRDLAKNQAMVQCDRKSLASTTTSATDVPSFR